MPRSQSTTVIAAAFVCVFALPPSVWARPPFKDALVRYYGGRLATPLKACATCHIVPPGMTEAQLAESAAEHNAFGRRLRELGEQLTADKQPATLAIRLERLADEDSDSDGVTNELELLAGSQPGDAAVKPNDETLGKSRQQQADFRAEYRWDPWRPVRRPDVPAMSVAGGGTAHPIDAFIATELAKRGIPARGAAPPAVLLRRLHLDLVGLPPTPDEVKAFLADPSPAAYDREVDKLLARPEYGQRWGRHWMDVWRYSDWAGWGAQVRDSQPHVWKWRDWIIDSVNADKPYDRMVTEMLAADELFPEDVDALRATGFLVRNFKLLSREQWITDTVNHTSKAFLGITMDCARCHDHRYDPLTQEEYYRLRAVFEPHNIRTDRVPGQVNVGQDGLVRVFDAQLAAPTYFFVRGDERQPDKDRVMTPGVPSALGNANFSTQEVSFSLAVRCPDRRSFVQDDDLRAADEAIGAARTKLTESQQKLAKAEAAAAAPGADASKTQPALAAVQVESRLAELDVPLAEARRSALDAMIRIERLEDSGARQSQPAEWEAAAQAAVAAQRREAVAEKRRAKQVADDALAKANAALAAAKDKSQAQPDDGAAKEELEKTTKAADEATKAVAGADDGLVKATASLDAPPSIEFAPRKLNIYPEKSTGRRAALARWITDRQNPLAARVAANHIWLRHFGQPLVGSMFDFGNNGQTPVLPQLVDWLAAEFMQPSLARTDGGWRPATSPAAGWSMKHLHRLIVTSVAYRRASTPDPVAAGLDPDNHYFWQVTPRRLEAEAVRDSVLFVAGQLDVSQGGPDIDNQEGLVSRRRSLYFRHAPEKQMTFLRLFDAASPNECYRRKESIVPQQALALANSPLSIEQSRRLARRLHAEQPADDAFVDAAFLAVLGRETRADEHQTCTTFLTEQRALFDRQAAALTAVATDPADVARPSADRTLRARENLVLVLLNHNDFVTIR